MSYLAIIYTQPTIKKEKLWERYCSAVKLVFAGKNAAALGFELAVYVAGDQARPSPDRV